MTRRLTLLLALALTALVAPSAASAKVQIYSINYNPIGTDTARNLNSEYVLLKNDGARAVSLRGWRLRDRQGNRFLFPRYSLGAGQTVAVRTGRRYAGSTDLFWGRSRHVWNNRGDVATLRRPSGRLVDRCAYVGNSLGYKQC